CATCSRGSPPSEQLGRRPAHAPGAARHTAAASRRPRSMPADPSRGGVVPQRCPRAASWARASGSMADPILFRLEGGLAWITLNRPEARNAINDEMRRALLDALARVAGDPAIRAAVLTGAGEGFCPAADLWRGRRDAAPPAHATRAPLKQNSQRL